MTKEIPLLTAADIECRVQQIARSQRTQNVGATLLLYKDARVDMRILDEVFGVGNWQRTHEVINGNLFCNIDIWDEDKHTWVRKQDVGTESNTEKEKGQASDSFKRAGFNVGIGRELYSAPFIYVVLGDHEYYVTKDGRGNDVYRLSSGITFSVKSIAYNERREIVALEIVDTKGTTRYTLGLPPQNLPQAPSRVQPVQKPVGSAPTAQRPQNAPQRPQQSAMACAGCGVPITDAEASFSLERFGKHLCRTCQRGGR